MTDATEAIARIRRTCSLPYPDNHSPYSTNFEFGTMRAILAHIDALTETAERNKWMCEVMDAEVVKQKTTIDAQAAEIERLRGLLCKCDMRTKLVGDGCEFCNPELADELKEQTE